MLHSASSSTDCIGLLLDVCVYFLDGCRCIHRNKRISVFSEAYDVKVPPPHDAQQNMIVPNLTASAVLTNVEM